MHAINVEGNIDSKQGHEEGEDGGEEEATRRGRAEGRKPHENGDHNAGARVRPEGICNGISDHLVVRIGVFIIDEEENPEEGEDGEEEGRNEPERCMRRFHPEWGRCCGILHVVLFHIELSIFHVNNRLGRRGRAQRNPFLPNAGENRALLDFLTQIGPSPQGCTDSAED